VAERWTFIGGCAIIRPYSFLPFAFTSNLNRTLKIPNIMPSLSQAHPDNDAITVKPSLVGVGRAVAAIFVFLVFLFGFYISVRALRRRWAKPTSPDIEVSCLTY
jgi:hypothetical protein